MRLCSVILIFLFSLPASAEILLSQQPTGASRVLNFVANGPNTALEIIGGLGGSAVAGECATANEFATCNNCTADWDVCNKTRVRDNSKVQFTFLSTTLAGVPVLAYTTGAGPDTPVNAQLSITPPTTASNQTVTLTVSWRDLCIAIDANTNGGGASDCSTVNGSRAFKIGISQANDGSLIESGDDSIPFTISVISPDVTTGGTGYATVYDSATATACQFGGICNFSLRKGDEKAYIENLDLRPSGNLGTYTEVLFYFSNTSFADITRDDEATAPIQISGTNALANDIISGLQNNVEYFFRASVMDRAGNIGLYLDSDSTFCPAGTTNCHQVIPQEVIGLFSDTNCFIATAAFGSPMQKHVKTLRRFRDQVLQKTWIGQLFVKSYYQLSPPLARWISQKSYRRAAARMVLAPFVISLSFAMNNPASFLVLLMTLVTGVLIFARRSRETLL
jgi:hypothetical protein